MTRAALVALVLVLMLAPAAAGKGEHASLSFSSDSVRPDRPWVATLTLFGFWLRRDSAPPAVVARSGGERIAVGVRPLSIYLSRHADVLGEARYRLRGTFPRAGRWSIVVTDGTPGARRFHFEPLRIGSSSNPLARDYMAVPRRNGAGQAIHTWFRAAPLPPEVVLPPAIESGGGGGAAVWIPATGTALAGAGALALLRRRPR